MSTAFRLARMHRHLLDVMLQAHRACQRQKLLNNSENGGSTVRSLVPNFLYKTVGKYKALAWMKI